VIDLQPDNSFGYQQIGFAHHNLGHTDEALRYYQLAIERQPTPQAYSNIGAIYHQRGEYVRAVEAYQHAISLRPNSHITHRNVGDALLKLGKIDEAREAYQHAARLAQSELKVNPRDANLQSILAVYLQKSDQSAQASAVVGEAVRAAPTDINVRYRAAVVSALQGHTRDAMQHLELAIRGGYSRDRAAEDDDFAALKKLPEFQSLVAKKT
jgi:serine/threonine-protein kinase